MPLPEATLEKIAHSELERILLRSDDELIALVEGIEMYTQTHQGVVVNFEIMVQKGAGKKQYRVTVFAYDDGPVREEFPVIAAAEIEFAK